MKIFIFLLIIASLLQSSFIPINLVLILLISRSLVSSEKENLWAAFFAGIIVGLLQGQNIGFWALIFLIVVKLTSLTKRLPFSRNILTVFIVSSLSILLVIIIEHLFFKNSFEYPQVLWTIILGTPFYFILLFWEERFVVKPDSRLKLRS